MLDPTPYPQKEVKEADERMAGFDSEEGCHSDNWGYPEGRWTKCWTRDSEQKNVQSEAGKEEKNVLELKREKKSILC